MIEIRCLQSLLQAEPYREAINRVNRASTRPDPFSSFEFYQNYLRNPERFPAGTSLWLLLAFDGEELLGYLALKHCMHRVLGLRATKLDTLTAFHGDRPQLMVRAEHASAVSASIYAYLLSRQSDWSLLEFAEQDAASTLLSSLNAAVSRNCEAKHWPNMANATIPIRWASTAAYFAALSQKARSNVSRQMRSLMAAGEVQMLTSADPQATGALFELYRSIEPNSWKRHADIAISPNPCSTAYYQGLLAPDQPMQGIIQVLLLDGVPIAGLISGAFEKRLYALHIVYDDRLARLAPGSAIFLMGVRLAIEGGYEAFNLLRGFGYYKARWLAHITETRSLQFYRVGQPFFWRRYLGDLSRRWFASAAAKSRSNETTQSNPARREVEKAEPAYAAGSLAPLATPAQHAHYAVLIAQACRGRGEFLSADALAAVLPFQTSRQGTPRCPLTAPSVGAAARAWNDAPVLARKPEQVRGQERIMAPAAP